MKKISSAILAAVALAAFGFVSCDHDYANSDIQAGTPSKVKQAEIDAANKGGSGNPVPSTTYAWTFANLDLTGTTWTSMADGSDVDASDGVVAKVAPASNLTYASSPAGLSLIVSAGSSSGSFNKISNSQAAKGDGSAGVAEPSKTDMLTVAVTGPFKATMIYGANSSSAKTDRTAQIVINGTVAKESDQNIPVDPVSMEYEYTGTDEVTVGFGGSNIVRIHDIKITK